MDHCRREMERDKRRAGSLDEEVETDEGDSRPRFEKEIAKREQRRIADEEELSRLAERRDGLDDAIARIDDERKRRVLEMTRDGCSTEEIATMLDTSEDNVYQLRRRALKLVRVILDG
jgi:RNA polymerase sigma factor (sigma-70 family)